MNTYNFDLTFDDCKFSLKKFSIKYPTFAEKIFSFIDIMRVCGDVDIIAAISDDYSCYPQENEILDYENCLGFIIHDKTIRVVGNMKDYEDKLKYIK